VSCKKLMQKLMLNVYCSSFEKCIQCKKTLNVIPPVQSQIILLELIRFYVN